ncbi:MAG: GyrI-like domain-containing protein, partial [Phycisphaerae bacterium]|nr:GyrI-like domain-containing protein [Phycisphaerae bacterium]
MEKLDFKKQFKDLYTASAKSPAIIEVPPMKFLMIDGQGDPQSQPFQEAIQTLYGMSFTAKFMLK